MVSLSSGRKPPWEVERCTAWKSEIRTSTVTFEEVTDVGELFLSETVCMVVMMVVMMMVVLVVARRMPVRAGDKRLGAEPLVGGTQPSSHNK